jgi:hypothetical protein
MRSPHRRAQGPADEPLDLLAAATRVAAGARVGRAREHGVFGGDPTLALPHQEGRHLFSTVAVQMTLVSPNSTRAEPSA